MESAQSLTEYQRAAEEAALRAAGVLAQWRAKFQVREKGRFDLVTDADVASQRAIHAYLTQKFPGHAFLAEEEGDAIHGHEAETEDEDYEGTEDGIDFRFLEHDEDGAVKGLDAAPAFAAGGVRQADRARLESVLQDLIAARQLLDQALKDG